MRAKYSGKHFYLGIAAVLLLCAALGGCVQTQVRGQYDVVIGGVRR